MMVEMMLQSLREPILNEVPAMLMDWLETLSSDPRVGRHQAERRLDDRAPATPSTRAYAPKGKRTSDPRERFLDILGHDLRNPLMAVVTAGALLGRDGLTPHQSKMVGRIQSSAQRMKRLVDVLLDFARSHSGEGIPIARAPVDMNEICRQVVDELKLVHPTRNLSFEAADEAHGCWDGDRVAQVVSNLVANALQHGKDPIRVAVRSEGGEVVLEVKNGGAAIPAHNLPSLFEPFRKGEGSAHGLGLGLFITREIVRAHGGTIRVASDEEATVFTIRWPRSSVEVRRRYAALCPQSQRRDERPWRPAAARVARQARRQPDARTLARPRRR